ncbi:hypothetical protein LL240_07050 [Oceanimonas baumannii]|uniref:hypothetical protein n=1 Tax=Oceanimonas baumannii TaxID=129578 RepID=UPI001D1880D8|nr:hypothetical protein [Oceanimonas baumannii]MCC4264210.1 hypothetical protein [Oceanimonas baumannii]
MSQQADYLALSKGARMHLKRTPDNRFYFRTSRQTKWFIWGMIALVCLLSPLLMSVVLDGGEQIFYMVVSVLLMLGAVFALGVRRHLLLNPVSGMLELETSWWGLGKSVRSKSALAKQRVVVAPIAEIEAGCLLEISDQKYTIGTADEVRQLALFIHQYFAVPAFDRVAQWPKEIELESLGGAASMHDGGTEGEQVVSGAAWVDPGAAYNSSAVIANPGAKYTSVWEQKILLKLALPFPLFLVLGLVLSLLANKGGA